MLAELTAENKSLQSQLQAQIQKHSLIDTDKESLSTALAKTRQDLSEQLGLHQEYSS